MWPTIARVAERWRIAVCVLVAAACGAAATTLGLGAEYAHVSSGARFALFFIVFLLSFTVAVIVATALLAIAEYLADRATRTDAVLPIATVVTSRHARTRD